MVDPVIFKTLGFPAICAADGSAVPVKTRKALAVLGYLMRSQQLSETRVALGTLLWSDSDKHKAAVSLRQSVRHLRAVEQRVGLSIITADTVRISIIPGTVRCDVDEVHTCLSENSLPSLARAVELVQGDFLQGLDSIDPAFSEWLVVEQERVRATLLSKATSLLEILTRNGFSERATLVARFLLKLEPAQEFAHQVLIRMYLEQGQRERAVQEFRDCEREMRLHFDTAPSAETRALLNDKTRGEGNARGFAEKSEGDAHKARGAYKLVVPESLGLDTSRRDLAFPAIWIASSITTDPACGLLRTARDELVGGLSGFRYFDLFETAYWADGTSPVPQRVDHGDLGCFLLRLRADPVSENLYLQLDNYATGRVVFNDVIVREDLQNEERRQAVVSSVVCRIENSITSSLRRQSSTSPFSRWCQAHALAGEYNAKADERAWVLISDLEEMHGNFSQIYSAKANILLKRILLFPFAQSSVKPDAAEALRLTEYALSLDPWSSRNQRTYGWVRLVQRRYEDADRAFQKAHKAAPFDPINLMSVATGAAYLGHGDMAGRCVSRAFEAVASVPRFFYGYSAAVRFGQGDYSQAAEYAGRAPLEDISALLLRIAACSVVGQTEDAAFSVRRLYNLVGQQLAAPTSVVKTRLQQWVETSNLFQDETVSSLYAEALSGACALERVS